MVVDSEGGAGEPSILITPEGAIFVAAPKGSARTRGDALWRSTDGGATFESLGMPTYPFGGGDTDLAIDGDGTIYMPGQWGARAPLPELGSPGYPFPFCESMAVSNDNGDSWTVNPVACVYAGAVDRQWVDTFGDSTAYMAYNQIPGGLAVVKSTDSGVTWLPMKIPVEGLTENEFSFRGNLATDKNDGTVYVGHASASGPSVWVSDGEGDFALKRTLEREDDVSAIFVVVAVGADGILHMTWSEDRGEQGRDIMLASSADKGDTWSEPVKVSEGDRTAVLPWVSAGAPGEVAVAWYESEWLGDPNEADDGATWVGMIATTRDGGATWTRARTTPEPIHQGVLCTNGSGCDPANRRLLDFFEVQIDAAGAAHVIMTDDTAGPEEPVLNLYVKAPLG